MVVSPVRDRENMKPEERLKRKLRRYGNMKYTLLEPEFGSIIDDLVASGELEEEYLDEVVTASLYREYGRKTKTRYIKLGKGK